MRTSHPPDSRFICDSIDASYKQFVEADGSMVVQLDKAAALWYSDLRSKLEKDGFVANPYDACVLNKLGPDGVQITVVVHVDDLLVTSASVTNLASFELYLQSAYPRYLYIVERFWTTSG